MEMFFCHFVSGLKSMNFCNHIYDYSNPRVHLCLKYILLL
jgi:hypothetical protein